MEAKRRVERTFENKICGVQYVALSTTKLQKIGEEDIVIRSYSILWLMCDKFYQRTQTAAVAWTCYGKSESNTVKSVIE